ncbi:MAG: NosD domain-containing protein, partial [Gemmatimonadales bacterium]
LVIRDNVFAWNTGGRSFGLVLQTANEPRVEGNLFVGNGTGTFFDNVIHGRYTGNLVAGNWLGLQLFGNSEATQVTGNAMIGNTFDASGGATPGAYVFCARGDGNYWHAAEGDGYDLDGDGVLDRSYQASSPLAELARSREGLRLFLGSPAARVLDWAERTFPVFAMDQAEDACPLARAPSLPAMAALPDEGDDAGTAGQYAVGAATLLAGAGILAVPVRRREARRAKEPRS